MPSNASGVIRLGDIDRRELCGLLARFELRLVHCPDGQPIPGSYWGDDEAGLQGNRIYARDDTPLHSILHETSHYICLDHARRRSLDTDAGSDDAEENAVCYLQILLADAIGGFDRDRLFNDMDAWGYSFRLGSTKAWFERDADDALEWLLRQDLIDHQQRPRYRLRQSASAC